MTDYEWLRFLQLINLMQPDGDVRGVPTSTWMAALQMDSETLEKEIENLCQKLGVKAEKCPILKDKVFTFQHFTPTS